MPQFTSYDQVGKKESVDDIISNINPTKTPFQSLLGDGEGVKNTIFNWQEDDLAAAKKNAQKEGFTATSATITPTRMRQNTTQILEKTVEVSGTTDSISAYGRAKELSYQLAKASVELKRDFELSLVGTGQTMVVGDSNTAREMAGYQAQIDSAVKVTADAGAGAAADLSEDHILTAGQKLYDAGAEGSVLMIKPSDSLKVAKFATAAGRTRDLGDSKKIVNTVDLLVTPFGEFKVVLNRFLKATDALLFDPELWKKMTLRGWTRETLAKTGDSTRVMLVGEFSLKHRNFKGSALITNLK